MLCKYMILVELCHLYCCHILAGSNKINHLREAIQNYHDGVMLPGSLREPSDEIHAYALPRARRNWQTVQLSWWLLRWLPISLTCGANL